MALPPSKLGRFILPQLWDADDAVLRSLRAAGLVKSNATDDELIAAFTRARREHEPMSEGARYFNSPHERVCFFLGPYLTRKGRKWAVPLKSLDPWWKFWG
jgi:hypothetical protein